MPYALNTLRGTSPFIEGIGEMPGLTAIPITDKQANMLKSRKNVIIFDKIAGINEEKAFKNKHGIEKQIAKEKEKDVLTYQQFVKKKSKKGKDMKEISKLWKEYKKEKNID